ncbi:MAG: transporter permease [Clostridia bacterium]|jgi:ABC-2 type transport system permease protein|nr:transporter permease [Clostridia bacterium]
MKVLNIAYYTILRNFRDYKTLTMMLLLPIMLILILGSALGGIFTPNSVSATTVCYLNQDKKFMSQDFEEFLGTDEIKELIEIKRVDSKEEAIQLIMNKEAASLIVLPSSFSEEIQNGRKASIEVYNSKYSSFRTSIVQSIINGFVKGTNAQLVVRQMGSSSPEYLRFDNLQEISVTAEGNTPRAIDYYAVTMLIMTIMYGTAYGNFALKEEKQLNTSIRLASAPIRYTEVILGKLLGSIVTVLLQAILIIIFTKIFFNVNWGGNIPFVIFVCFSLTLLSVGLGMMVSNLGKNPQATGALLNFGVNIMTFIAGGYFPASQMGPLMEKIGFISPNYLAQQAIFNTIYEGSSVQTMNFMLGIWIILIISFIIAGFTERRSAN